MQYFDIGAIFLAYSLTSGENFAGVLHQHYFSTCIGMSVPLLHTLTTLTLTPTTDRQQLIFGSPRCFNENIWQPQLNNIKHQMELIPYVWWVHRIRSIFIVVSRVCNVHVLWLIAYQNITHKKYSTPFHPNISAEVSLAPSFFSHFFIFMQLMKTSGEKVGKAPRGPPV